MVSPISVTKKVFVLDCPDAHSLADFYAGLLGWETETTDGYDGWVEIRPPGDIPADFRIAFQEISGYVAPTWPEGPVPQQAHCDFYVDSLPEATVLAEKAGAVKHPVQPSERGDFVVFTDPVGHLFCLCISG